MECQRLVKCNLLGSVVREQHLLSHMVIPLKNGLEEIVRQGSMLGAKGFWPKSVTPYIFHVIPTLMILIGGREWENPGALNFPPDFPTEDNDCASRFI